MRFKQFIEATASGMMQQDFTTLSQQERMAQGRDIGEPFIRKCLLKHGVYIEPSRGYDQDAKQKIDGFLNGDPSEPVQIKLKRSGVPGRNDITYEVAIKQDRRFPVRSQMQGNQIGRDYKGSKNVKHYFVLNKDETQIYYFNAESLKKAADVALDELEMERGGILQRPFTSATNGTQLRPTEDRGSNAYAGFKVMAFIPVESVIVKSYRVLSDAEMEDEPVSVQPARATFGAPQPAQLPPYKPPVNNNKGRVPNLDARPRRRTG